MRRHEELAMEWQSRMFGRRTHRYVWTVWALASVACALDLHGRWLFAAGGCLGLFGGSWLFIPAALMPDYIRRWERGAWGEQLTAKELKPLRKEGWSIVHDRASNYGNRDHIVAGPCVFLLDTKNLDGTVTIEGSAIRVTNQHANTTYLMDRVVSSAGNAARALKREADVALGFGVSVYPVIVIWAEFEDRSTWVDDVAIVRGDAVAEFIRDRPTDLFGVKQAEVRRWAEELTPA